MDQREWTCPKCETKHDRDINAGINIERQGLNLLNRRNYGVVTGSGSKTTVDCVPQEQKTTEMHSTLKRETHPSLAGG